MARGAAKAKQRQARKPAAPPPKRAPRRATPRSVEDTMFFPRLRNHAKWAFGLMVLVFALGFVFLGVGSGSSGIGDLLQGHFKDLFGGGSSTSVSKLQDKVEKNPKDAHSWRLLGVQLDTNNHPDAAIRAFRRYVALVDKPSPDVLSRLGALEFQRGVDYQNRVYSVQQEGPQANPFGPPTTSKFGQALATDPIAQAFSTSTQATIQRALAASQRDFAGAVKTYQRLSKTSAGRSDALVYQSLGQAGELAGNTKVAIAAYAKFLKLAPDSANAPVVRQRMKALKLQAKQTAAASKPRR